MSIFCFTTDESSSQCKLRTFKDSFEQNSTCFEHEKMDEKLERKNKNFKNDHHICRRRVAPRSE